MPISKSPGSYGNLKVKFDIAFPTSLTDQQKKVLKDVL